ncbi:unnamed protein product, partial [marine sediment metagenome]
SVIDSRTQIQVSSGITYDYDSGDSIVFVVDSSRLTARSATTLSADAAAAASSFSVASAADFKKGDKLILISDDDTDRGKWEEITIQSISNNTITIAGTLTNTYDSGDTVYHKGLVTIQGSDDAGATWARIFQRDADARITDVTFVSETLKFAGSGTSGKIRIELERTNYEGETVKLYDIGIAYRDPKRFEIVQYDNNNVRLYNYSGETANVRLDVLTSGMAGGNSGTVSLAAAVADVDRDPYPSIFINDTGGGDLFRLQTDE